MVQCNKCGLIAHNCKVAHDHKMHELEGYEHYSCFQILHSKTYKDLWNHTTNLDSQEGKKYSVYTSHEIYTQLKSMYGHSSKMRKQSITIESHGKII